MLLNQWLGNNLVRPPSLALCLKSRRCFRKVLTDTVHFKVVNLDPAAAEKHQLRIIIIIIIVIIIILWYNKDIWLPTQAHWGVQWFAVAMVQWSPLGFAVGSTRLSVKQSSVRSLQGWEGFNKRAVIHLPLISFGKPVQLFWIMSPTFNHDYWDSIDY